MCGQSVTTQLITPKRSSPLPEILNRREIRDLLAAATTPRDQLLLGLLYGCGIKPGELNRLTWADIDSPASAVFSKLGAISLQYPAIDDDRFVFCGGILSLIVV